MDQYGDYKEDQEDKEEDLRGIRCYGRNAAKSEHRSDDRDHQKQDGKTKHWDFFPSRRD
jgi:hypothetical protein